MSVFGVSMSESLTCMSESRRDRTDSSTENSQTEKTAFSVVKRDLSKISRNSASDQRFAMKIYIFLLQSSIFNPTKALGSSWFTVHFPCAIDIYGKN